MDFRIFKGKSIDLKGVPERKVSELFSSTYSFKPIDFHGLKPKLNVKIGESILSGDALFFDKDYPKIKYTSSVSGIVSNIIRGKKRRLSEIIVKSHKKNKYKKFDILGYKKFSIQKLKDLLFDSGLWSLIQQRPFSVVADPLKEPKSIFISCFDSSPLAPDYNFILSQNKTAFQKGIDVLSSFCLGKIHLNINGEADFSDFFHNVKDVQLNRFYGPHPSGNVGVQIHHIDPINKGDVVWVLNPQSLITIGKFFLTGKYENFKMMAVTGSEIKNPQYYNIFQGVNISKILKGNVYSGNKRYISGNVLFGDKIERDGHLGFYEDQLTVIPEGDYYELFGWALPGFKKYSFSRAFLSALFPKKNIVLDTNMHGEERAYVVSGQYENLVPMDIFPVQLIKAIMIEDIELMESLGIYEVAPEDFALCEFSCTSKMPVQEIIRYGLDLVKKECS